MPNRLFTRLGIAGSFGGMLLVGGLEALYGPSLIQLIRRFEAPPSAVGMVVSAHFLGGLVGVLSAQGLHARAGNRVLLRAGYALLIGGSICFAWTPTLALAITASAAAGLGFGVLDYAFSQLFAVAFASEAPKMLNLLHGFFGIGAIVAPLVIALFGPEHYPAYFTAFALLALTAAAGIAGVAAFPTQRPVALEGFRAGAASAPAPTARPRVAFIAGFAAMVSIFIFHVAVGSGIGSWEAAYLTLAGVSPEHAAAATSLFWLSMTASRFALAPVIKHSRPGTVVTLSCALMALGSLAAAVPGFAVAGLAMVGIAIGPIFPTALAWAAEVFGGKPRVSGTLIAVSMLGGVFFPPLLGSAVTPDAGAALFPLALTLLSMLCLASCAAMGGLPLRRSGTRPGKRTASSRPGGA